MIYNLSDLIQFNILNLNSWNRKLFSGKKLQSQADEGKIPSYPFAPSTT